MFKWLKRFRARLLANRAFFLVEQHDFDAAIALLNRAVEIAPTYGSAHNELSYIYDKSGQFDKGEEAARRAIECNPQNPKFYNSLMGIFIDRARTLRTQKEVTTSLVERLKQIDIAIAAHPHYPPLHFSRANLLALCGKPQDEWEAELVAAQKLYSGCSRAACGLPLQPGQVNVFVARNNHLCLEMARYWQSLPQE